MVVERYSHVMHLVSHVRGVLAPGKDAFDVLAACFPAGTLTGAPKIRAMEIIEELEPTRRGPYGGAVGYVSYSGNLDSCITIRTVVCHGGRASIQVGAGIVADSDPKTEWLETCSKARGMILALRIAGQEKRPMIFVIDNYDSFTYNLVQYLGELGADLQVVRNDAIRLEDGDRARPRARRHLARPGQPGRSGYHAWAPSSVSTRPPRSWASASDIRRSARPSAGRSARARAQMHGKTSRIQPRRPGRVPGPAAGLRGHALSLADGPRGPACPPICRCRRARRRGVIMGLRHRRYPVEGVQFHPESILTRQGKALLEELPRAACPPPRLRPAAGR